MSVDTSPTATSDVVSAAHSDTAGAVGRHRTGGTRHRVGLVLRVLSGLAVAAVVTLLVLLVVLPRVAGWVPLTVLSGSMEPTIPTGSQVVVERIESETQVAALAPGDVVAFMPKPGDPTLVLHRVVSTSTDTTGTTRVTTRGDANDEVDPGSVSVEQLRGLARYHVPWAGHLAQLLDGQQKQTGALAVAGGLGLYVLWQVGGALRERRAAARSSTGS